MELKISKNKKRNAMLNDIIEEAIESMGIEDIKRYSREFRFEFDYNIAQFGNLLVYYNQVFDFYNKHNYATDRLNNDAIWKKYKFDVGCAIRALLEYAGQDE